MEKVKFTRGVTGGRITVPPSKSFAHRAILCSALSGKPCRISRFSMSRDMEATLNFVSALGGGYECSDDLLTVLPLGQSTPEGGGKKREIDCIESGSTLRFILPLLGALGVPARIIGRGRLPERPLGVYSELLPRHGMELSASCLPLSVQGRLKSGLYELPGNISSQFITGLLLALPLLEGESEIRLTTELESADYVQITLSILQEYGIQVFPTERGWRIPGGQCCRAADYRVEGDWSQAAFFLTMGALSREPVELEGLLPDSVQGDRKALELYRRIGAKISCNNGVLSICRGELRAIQADVRDIPDVVPTLAACLSLCEGTSVITGAGRLRIKESDRLTAVAEAMNALGACVTEQEEGLVIRGVPYLRGGEVNGRNDHRIVMAAASVAGACRGELLVTDPWSVQKSYPGFYEDFQALGGIAHVISMGE